MDIGAFVQENRKWLIGCAVGLIAYLIAYAVIDSIYDPGSVSAGVTAAARSAPTNVYSSSQRDELIAEQEALAAERQRLTRALAFERSAEYRLAPGSEAGRFLFQAGRTLKQGILNSADERNVQLTDKEITWPVPIAVDEIQRVLFGLELLDEAATRLFAAHDAVRAVDPEAVGLRSILQLRYEQQQRGGRPAFAGARQGSVELRDYVEQERLMFKFEADAATVTAFFEACRAPGRTLVLERVQEQQPDRIGDPLIVTGSLAGIAFKEPPQ